MLTAQVESLTERLEEMKPLFPLHWEELALNKDKVPLDPQYDEYLRRDANGQVVFLTLRDKGELVGYFVGFVAPGLHYQTCLTLHMDILYLRQDRRGAMGGTILLNAVKVEAKRRGVQRMFLGHKTHMDIGSLFKRIGAEHVESTYSIWLGSPATLEEGPDDDPKVWPDLSILEK